MADQGGLKRTDADQFGPKTAQKWMYALCFKPEPDSVKSVRPPFLVSRADLSARVYLAHLSALFWSAASDIHPWKNISCAQASRSGRVLTYVIAYRSNGHYMPSTRSNNSQASEGKSPPFLVNRADWSAFVCLAHLSALFSSADQSCHLATVSYLFPRTKLKLCCD